MSLLIDEPIDEEVALLVEGIAEEVAAIGVLCDTLRDRLLSVSTDLEGRGMDRDHSAPSLSTLARGLAIAIDACTTAEGGSPEMPMKLMVLGAALIAGTLLSGLASAQDELPAAPSPGPTTGLNEIPQLRGPIINQPDTISASTSPTDKPEEMNTVLRGTKSSRVRKDSDRVNAVNDPGKLPGTGSVAR